jgi:hypothetical protein
MTAPLSWTLDWPQGKATVLETGGILWDCAFRLPDGRWFKPFAQAPWGGKIPEDKFAGHMRWLGGEFPCLPFGVGGLLRDPVPAWAKVLNDDVNDPPHGHAANDAWTAISASQNHVELQLNYPESHDIARLTRRIRAVPGRARLEFELAIEARRAASYPIGLHPILRLPDRAGALQIEAGFEIGLTYPAVIEPDRMLAEPGKEFHDLAKVPARHGGIVDLTRMPAGEAEDVVQLLGIKGPVHATFLDDKAVLELDWDRDLLPSCQIWVSDRALKTEPWNGSFRGLGIEPTVAAFDFARSNSLMHSPINDLGYATSLALQPGSPTTIRYSVEVGSL